MQSINSHFVAYIAFDDEHMVYVRPATFNKYKYNYSRSGSTFNSINLCQKLVMFHNLILFIITNLSLLNDSEIKELFYFNKHY